MKRGPIKDSTEALLAIQTRSAAGVSLPGRRCRAQGTLLGRQPANSGPLDAGIGRASGPCGLETPHSYALGRGFRHGDCRQHHLRHPFIWGLPHVRAMANSAGPLGASAGAEFAGYAAGPSPQREVGNRRKAPRALGCAGGRESLALQRYFQTRRRYSVWRVWGGFNSAFSICMGFAASSGRRRSHLPLDWPHWRSPRQIPSLPRLGRYAAEDRGC